MELDDAGEVFDGAVISLTFSNNRGELMIGACVYERIARTGEEDPKLYSLELYDFIEGEQLSGLDSLLMKYSESIVYLSEEYEGGEKGLSAKLQNLFLGKSNCKVSYVRKNSYKIKSIEDLENDLKKLIGETNATHELTVVEKQHPLGLTCVDIIDRKSVV